MRLVDWLSRAVAVWQNKYSKLFLSFLDCGEGSPPIYRSWNYVPRICVERATLGLPLFNNKLLLNFAPGLGEWQLPGLYRLKVWSTVFTLCIVRISSVA